MKEKGILKKDIEKVLLNPDRIYRENHRVIASKRINKEILEVVYVVENNFNLLLLMKITYEKMADALYIYLRKGRVAKTKKVTNRLLIDVDKRGNVLNVLGIEMLEVSRQIPPKEIGRISTEMPVYT